MGDYNYSNGPIESIKTKDDPNFIYLIDPVELLLRDKNILYITKTSEEKINFCKDRLFHYFYILEDIEISELILKNEIKVTDNSILKTKKSYIFS